MDDLRRDEISEQLRFHGLYQHLDRAARCKACDWQLPFDESDFYSILLPAAQNLRSYARFLAARARTEVAEGQFDDAIRTLRIGYALGRNAAEGETLINGLIGIAICAHMSRQTVDFIQQPDAPNLYWALTRLPRPMISLNRAADAEMNAIYWSFPELQDAEGSTHDAEYWRKALLGFWKKFVTFTGSDSPLLVDRPEALTAMCLKGYPLAKRALLDRGMAPERVESMPVAQVIAIHTIRTFDELRDDMFKWFWVPYAEGREGLQKANKELTLAHASEEVLPLARLLLPAIGACHSSAARCDREFAVLRILEALRMYGASHGGKLPQSLEAITDVPIPDDPYTGKPFKYTFHNDVAVLEPSSGPNPPGLFLRLRIEFAK